MLVTQPSKITEKNGQRKRKNNPRPHVESNHDLAFRKRPFYPLNYRGGIKSSHKTRWPLESQLYFKP